MCLRRLATCSRRYSPGIMSHNVTLQSDWHGERHREGWDKGTGDRARKKGEREIIMMVMMRVMMRGDEPKQRQSEKKRGVYLFLSLCLTLLVSNSHQSYIHLPRSSLCLSIILSPPFFGHPISQISSAENNLKCVFSLAV